MRGRGKGSFSSEHFTSTMKSSCTTECYQRSIQVKHEHLLLGSMITIFISRKTEDQREPDWASKLGWWNCQLKGVF